MGEGDLALECTLEALTNRGAVVLELVKGGRQFRCRFDLATGKKDALPDYQIRPTSAGNITRYGPLGREIAALGRGFILEGGRSFQHETARFGFDGRGAADGRRDPVVALGDFHREVVAVAGFETVGAV